MGGLIRQTNISVVKRLVRGRWNTTLKLGGGNSLHYIFMQGLKSLRIHLKPKEATFYILEVSQEATGRAYGDILTSNDAMMVSNCTIIAQLSTSIHSTSP